MPMTELRKGEISLAIVRGFLRSRGSHLSIHELVGQIPTASQAGISDMEYSEYLEVMAREYIAEQWAKGQDKER